MNRQMKGMAVLATFLFAFAVVLVLAGCSAESTALSESGSAEQGAKIFQEKCSICHTIGGGKKLGPDLKGVTEKRSPEWLASFIADSGKMFEQQDPVADGLLREFNGFKMPSSGLSEQQVSDVITYMTSKDAADPTSSAKPEQDSSASPSDKDSVAQGETIFKGKCSICHTIGGGHKMGPDLTGVTEKRSPEWLTAFISDPGKMFTDKDPIATELLKESKTGFKMRNPGLTSDQVSDVINYLKSKDAATQTAPVNEDEKETE